MTKQKRGFWLFIFSLIPGAGEMYMGFKKQGLSIMAIFWSVILFATFIETGAVLVALPIIWFYSFFNVHNLKSLSEEEFYSIEDDYLLNMGRLVNANVDGIKKYRTFIAIALIFTGCSILWKTMLSSLYGILPQFIADIIYRLGNMVPRVLIAFAIIYVGIYLIRGKKKELDYDENA